MRSVTTPLFHPRPVLAAGAGQAPGEATTGDLSRFPTMSKDRS